MTQMGQWRTAALIEQHVSKFLRAHVEELTKIHALIAPDSDAADRLLTQIGVAQACATELANWRETQA